jgi:hypothetical protein
VPESVGVPVADTCLLAELDEFVTEVVRVVRNADGGGEDQP